MKKEDFESKFKLNDSQPSLTYWCSILNLFEMNTNTLSRDQLQALADESERCRHYWNEEPRDLKIGRHDVNPNIHLYLVRTEIEELSLTEIYTDILTA